MKSIAAFFQGNRKKIDLYEFLMGKLSHLINLKLKQRKSNSMLVLCNRSNFGYMLNTDSDGNEMAKGFTLVFSLRRRVDAPCISRMTQPHPNRWSHHVTIDTTDAVNDRLIAWLEEAYRFAG